MEKKNYNPQGDVANFMTACGQAVPTTPTMPDREVLLLRSKLLFEEVTEFIVAAGCQIKVTASTGIPFLEIDETIEPDMVEMYDAIVDINYVSYGAACTLGLQVQPGHDEVHRSNMTKVNPDGTVTKNSAGKVMKPIGYSKPDLGKIIEQQKLKEAHG